MKCVIVISCFLLVSFAEFKNLPRRYRDAGVSNSDTVRDTEPSKQCKCEGLGSIMQAPCDGPDSAICKCVYGYYRDQESNTCKECKACETGYGLVYPCDDSHDTRCEKCLKGTYSDGANRIDPCFPCTICEEDEIVIKQCTTVSDTVCNTVPRVTQSQPRIEVLRNLDTENVFLNVFSQFLQQATFEEVHKLLEDVVTFAKKCFADGFAGPGCNDSLFSFFPDQMCAAAGLPEKYGYADCCVKANPERKDCLVSHKNASSEFISSFRKPDAQESCTQFQANPDLTVQRFIYEHARRHPNSYFIGTDEYTSLLTRCCQATDKEACFNERFPPPGKRELEFKGEPQVNCAALKASGTSSMESMEHILLSQQFPQANLSTILATAKHLAESYTYCCGGDSVKCLFMERDVAEYICAHHDTVSSKFKKICEKDIYSVLGTGDNDDLPPGLPPTDREFFEDKDVCRHYAENRAAHLGKFRYENGRRHPELPPYLLLRTAEDYDTLLEKCCAREHPEQCLHQGGGLLEKHIAESLKLIDLNCDLYAQAGDYGFQNVHLVSFTKNAPQLPFEEMYQYTKELNAAAHECCHRNATQRLACAERKVETVLGNVCSRHHQKPINALVDKCCSGSFPSWMSCFDGLGIDPGYTHPAFEPKFHPDLCSLEEANLNRQKQKLLVDVVKNNPELTEEQLLAILTEIQTLLTKCCEAEQKEACFKEEGQKLTDRINASSGTH